MTDLKPLRYLLYGAYLVMWVGGIFNYVVFGKPPLDAPWAASLFLALAGVIVLVGSNSGQVRALVAAASIGLLAEIVGVRYGFIFSPYSYTRILLPHLLGVPIVMFSAWMVLVAYSRQLFSSFGLPRFVEAILGAAWMTAIDLVIDPLAANQLGYWRWVDTGAYYGIPLHNFIGWFVVSLLIFVVVRLPRSEPPHALLVGLSIVLFFSVIALSFRLQLPGVIGLALAAIHLALFYRKSLISGWPSGDGANASRAGE